MIGLAVNPRILIMIKSFNSRTINEQTVTMVTVFKLAWMGKGRWLNKLFIDNLLRCFSYQNFRSAVTKAFKMISKRHQNKWGFTTSAKFEVFLPGG